jgi:hypothetical protein
MRQAKDGLFPLTPFFPQLTPNPTFEPGGTAMSITVVNLANMPINSATNQASFNYSVHNAISPTHYYVHDTIPGFYDLRVRWWCARNPEYESEIATVVGIAVGIPLAALGLTAVVLGAVPLVGAVGVSAFAIVGAVGGGISGVGSVLGTTVPWMISGPKVAAANDRKVENIEAIKDKVFVVTGKVPLELKKTAEGKIYEARSEDPNKFPIEVKEISRGDFDKMVDKAQISQSRVALAADTASLLRPRQNRRRRFHLGRGVELASDCRYWIENRMPKYDGVGILGAHNGEGNDSNYCVSKSSQKNLPEAHWQFIPVTGDDRDVMDKRRIFAICERLWSKFMVDDNSRNKMQLAKEMKSAYIKNPDSDDPRFHMRDPKDTPAKLGWTPYFEVLPTESGYWWISPVWDLTSKQEFDPQKRRFLSAHDHPTTDSIYSILGRKTSSLDEWKITPVTQ